MKVPHYGDFPGGLGIGKAVRFKGYVNENADRFEINLTCDNDAKVIALHFNPRFDEEDVVLNTYIDDWQEEERDQGSFPFQRGEYYDVLFVAHDGQFFIYVNDTYFTNFAFRVPVEDIFYLDVQGDVTLMDVDLMKRLPEDFVESVPSGIKKTDLIVVKGFFYPEGERFFINLHFGNSVDDDIALHFNPRRDEGELYLNSTSEGEWEQEECHPLPQCLLDAVEFEVELYAKKKNKFEIFVNHVKCDSFKVRGNVKDIRGINAGGDAYIHRVDFLQTVNLPCVTDIPATLKPDSWISIMGVPKKDANSFAINLQCGDDDDYGSDVAFHFNPRFNGEGTIRSTLEEGAWGEDETDQPDFPFTPEELFEVDIHCMSDIYRVYVEHEHYIDFAHRISLSHVSHVMVIGDCDFFEPEFY